MASVDYFLKIDGIDGESVDAKHKGSIQIDSFSWGQSNAGTHSAGGGGGAGKVAMQDFHFTMNTNKASVKLMLACATGEHIKSAKLTCRKAGKEQQEYLVIDFSDLLISSYQLGGAGSSGLPTESISFNFSKVEFNYREQKADGTLQAPIKAGYDLKKQVKV